MSTLPCEQMKAELARLCRVHGRSMDEGELRATWNASGKLCMAVSFPDGMAWEVPFAPEAQAVIDGRCATKH